MADLVSFGVAPAVLVFNAGLQFAGIQVGSGQFWVLLTACGIFVLGGAMRLARFNLATDQPRGWFTGVPITGAGGGLVASMILVLIHHQDIAELLPLHRYLPISMFVLAILMVSRLRFPKAVIRKNKLHNVFMFANVAAIFYCGIFRVFPEYLFGMGLILLVSGIIAGRITREA
jgi:CDP-diacylglycerol--serine O-phosphatidyltransferase